MRGAGSFVTSHASLKVPGGSATTELGFGLVEWQVKLCLVIAQNGSALNPADKKYPAIAPALFTDTRQDEIPGAGCLQKATNSLASRPIKLTTNENTLLAGSFLRRF
jgi:hypothetical protein